MGALVSSGQVPIWLLSMPVSLGAMVAVVLGLLGRQMALPRFYGLAMISLLVGVLSALGSVEFVGAMFFLVLMGAILLASGGLTLWRYTRQAPPPVEMEDEHGG